MLSGGSGAAAGSLGWSQGSLSPAALQVSGKLFVEPASILKQVDVHRYAASDAEAFAGLAAMQGVPCGARSVEGQQAAMAMLRILGEGYQLLCNYK